MHKKRGGNYTSFVGSICHVAPNIDQLVNILARIILVLIRFVK